MQNQNVIQLSSTPTPMERLRENAILLSVEVHCPSFTKTDRKASAEHSRNRNAKVGRHNISKLLIESPLLAAIPVTRR